MSREIVDVCNNCGEVPEEFEPYYKCNECGESFIKSNSFRGISNRCPSCNLFGEKISDNGCTSCQSGYTEPQIKYRCVECDLISDLESESKNCCKL